MPCPVPRGEARLRSFRQVGRWAISNPLAAPDGSLFPLLCPPGNGGDEKGEGKINQKRSWKRSGQRQTTVGKLRNPGSRSPRIHSFGLIEIEVPQTCLWGWGRRIRRWPRILCRAKKGRKGEKAGEAFCAAVGE